MINEKDLIQHMSSKQRLSAGTIATRHSRARIFIAWLGDSRKEITHEVIESFFYFLRTLQTHSIAKWNYNKALKLHLARSAYISLTYFSCHR